MVPNVIILIIIEEKLPQKSDAQPYNYLSRLKTKHLGLSQCTSGDFIQWFESRTEVPDDDDTVFVVDYGHRVNMETLSIGSFRCFISKIFYIYGS
jgi:hypothetical protein